MLFKERVIIFEDDAVDSHHDFVECKKLCMLYLIDAEGGVLILHSDSGDVEIELTPNQNKLVIFREDQMSYTYEPIGKHVAVQSWILDKPIQQKLKEESLRVIDGPEEPAGERINVMSLTGRYPGKGFDGDSFWNMLSSGGDTQIHVPLMRWDTDIYY